MASNMKAYTQMSKEELLELKSQLAEKYAEYKGLKLNLNMARGKPCTAQLELSMPILDAIDSKSDVFSENGSDCRNYGELEGIPEARRLMGEMLGVPAENVIVYGNSSLNIMYDTVARCSLYGVMGSIPWSKLDRVKFLCPAPGYDRHFAITQAFGFELVTIPMTETGPDMDLVEEYVSTDESVKGIWCVPKYSNPQGYTYSDETVKRLAALKPRAKDFRIFWDNAYCMHDLTDETVELLEILSECKKAGNPDMVYEFVSTSKISFAGGGLSAMACSEKNVEEVKKHLSFQTIGHDKLNQLRHVRYFKDFEGMKAHVAKLSAVIKPKFTLVENILEEELGGLDIGTWTNPKGGYFISFDSLHDCAKKIVKMCKDAGVIMTDAGATYPYGKDPFDSNIRIAPTYPTLKDLELAARIFTLCVKLASIDYYLAKL